MAWTPIPTPASDTPRWQLCRITAGISEWWAGAGPSKADRADAVNFETREDAQTCADRLNSLRTSEQS